MEVFMNAGQRIPHLFFIDLAGQTVFCRACGRVCRSLVLADSVQFWCATKDCDNHADIRLCQDGSWVVSEFQEKWHKTLISEIVPRILQRIVPGKNLHKRR
jgi:hypothetical protein